MKINKTFKILGFFKEKQQKIEKCYIIKENVLKKSFLLISYGVLNIGFSVSLQIFMNSLTFLEEIHFDFKVF